MPEDRSDNAGDMRWLLAMPVGHEPDWPTAERHVEALTTKELDAFAERTAAILGYREAPSAKVVHQRLRYAIAEVPAATNGAHLGVVSRHASDADPSDSRARRAVEGGAS